MNKNKVNISEIHRIGVDLAKNVIQVYAVDRDGGKLLNRRFRTAGAVSFFESLESCEIGIEACGGAHHWGRTLTGMGHQVRMMPAQYVRPFVKTNKTDAADAQAIVEAMVRPEMRFVEIKSSEQQSVLLAHQVRSQLIKQRTQTANALRSHCAEFGVVYRKGIRHVAGICEMVRKQADHRIPSQAYGLLSLLVDQFESLARAIGEAEAQIRSYFRQSEVCQRLASVPGIGVLTATALVASIGHAGQFRSGRHLAAWLGLVPKQHSSGEKQKLLGISKRGNRYLRKLLIHGPGRFAHNALSIQGAHRPSSGDFYRISKSRPMWRRWRWPTPMPGLSGHCCITASATTPITFPFAGGTMPWRNSPKWNGIQTVSHSSFVD